jgi:CHAD domain-containing protein
MAFEIERIHKSSRKVAKFLKKNVKRPGSDAIHDLRTGSRSLATSFMTLGLDSKARVKRFLRDLAGVRKRAGKVRDMDVLTANVLTLKQNGEQDCLVQLLEHLGAQRAKHVKTLRRVIKADAPRLRRNLKRNSKRLETVLRQAQDNPTRSDVIPDTMAKIIQLSSELHSPPRLNRSNLHPYRLKVKELRNVLQLSAQTADQVLLNKLGEVKDSIGDWHDWEALISIASQVLDHGAACKLTKQLKKTSDSKYERALSSAHQLRNKYLTAKGRNHKARQLKTAPSAAVIRATSAVAAD